MKTICQRGLALLTTLALMLTWAVPAFAAGETYQVQYDVTYDQSEARTMLDMVNDFRTGGDAWYWDESDTNQVQVSGLQPLTYDYELEKVAMQRAAEVAISFSHTRPDGTACWTAFDEVGSNFGYSHAENIAAGRTTAAATFEQWQETDEDYAGQGHRRNMLSSDKTTFAIGHVVYQGIHFWVQEFGTNVAGDTETPANDVETTVTVQISSEQLTQATVTTPEPLTLNMGETEELPPVEASIAVTDVWMSQPVVTSQASWQTDANGVVLVDGSQVTALKAGTTTLNGTVLGQTVTLDLTVQPASLEGAAVTLDQTQFAVTGSEIRPAVTVTLDGKTLTEGTDYDVTYTNNKEIGTATVTVTGIGNYAGTAQTTFDIVECVHQWDEGTVTTEPFCDREGVMTYTCTVCHATRTEPIAMKPHTPMTIPGVEPTCTVAGRSDAKICSTCGNTLEDAHELPALGHDWTEWEEVQSPSCTASGRRQRGCNRCGYIEIENLNPLGHDFGEWQITKEPTCTEEGEQTRACNRCDETETAPVAALGHDFGEWQTTKEPSCTTEGESTRYCSRCDASETEPIAKTEHTPEVIPGKAATCTEAGLTDGSKCSVCGTIFTAQEEIPALGHDWGEWQTTKEPSCTTEGESTRYCSRCDASETKPIAKTEHMPEVIPGKAATCTETGLTDGSKCSVCGTIFTEQEEIPALGHTFGEWQTVESPSCTASGSEERVCERCGYTETRDLDPTGHTWNSEPTVDKEPTCTEEGSQSIHCANCDATKDSQVIPALGHDWGEWQITKEPTCTEEGEQTRACTRCDETETETIPATGHRYATTWTSDASGHWHACEICGDRKDQEAHSWEWVIDQQPTGTQPGKQHQQCTVCGYKGREDTILTATLPDAEPDTSYRVQMYGNTPESAVQTEMLRQAMNKLPVSAEYDVMNIRTIFYEIALQYKIGESAWTDMEAAGRSVTITLPYPDGTNATDCDFIVTHYMDDNTVEQPAVTETENGLQVTLQGLSPVAVTSYQLQAKEMPKPDTGSEEKNPPASPDPAPETASSPSSEPAATAAPAQATTPQSSIPATADDFPLALLVVLCAAGAGGLAVLTFKRRRNR